MATTLNISITLLALPPAAGLWIPSSRATPAWVAIPPRLLFLQRRELLKRMIWRWKQYWDESNWCWRTCTFHRHARWWYTHRLAYDKSQYSGAKKTKVVEQNVDKIVRNILTGSGTARGSLSPLSIQPCSANKSLVQMFVFWEYHKFVKKKNSLNTFNSSHVLLTLRNRLCMFFSSISLKCNVQAIKGLSYTFPS